MKRFLVIFLIIAVYVVNVFTQTPVDSLKTALQSATTVEKRIDILNRLADALNHADSEAATQYAMEALELARASGKQHLLGKPYRNLSTINKNTGLTEVAMAYADSALWCYETEMMKMESTLMLEEKLLAEIQAQKNRQRLHISIVASAFLFVVIGLIYVPYRAKQRLANLVNSRKNELPPQSLQAERLKQNIESQNNLLGILNAHSLTENKTSEKAPAIDLENTNLDSVRQLFIAKMKQTVIQHMANPQFGIKQLSEKAFLGERQLRRKITEITGLPPLEFIRQIRLLHAKMLIEQHTHHTIAEVSTAVGFNNPAYFSRLFKKRFGITPHELFASKPA